MSLKISKKLELPDEAITQTFAILAKRGVGKTYTASVMAEEMIKNNLPVIILDPIGVWWGLRSSADGKKAGLPIIIAGGDHADVPITPDNGEVVANLVVNEKLSVVIDLSLFRKGEQTRFVTDFAETLYHKNRTALHLIVDEADAFAPQRPMPGQQRLLGAMEDLVRRGRARGIGVTMITQRPAVINKDVLTQIEVLVTLRLISPQDRAAINEWVKVHGEEGQAQELMQSLPSLPIGTAWFWSPGWLDLFQRVEVRKRETLDSSSTPKIGKLKVEPRNMADVNLDKIRESLSSTIEQMESEDPKLLRRRIIELERQLADQKPQVEVKEVPIITPAQMEKLAEMVTDAKNATKRLADFSEEFNKIIPNLQSSVNLDKFSPPPKFNKTPSEVNLPKAAPIILPADKNIEVIDGQPNLRAGERRILEVLARHFPMKFTRNQLATVSRFSPKGGTYGTYFGTLKRNGFIHEEAGQVNISQAGLSYLGEFPRKPHTTEEIINMWRSALRAGERKMLDILVEFYPQSMSREYLGEKAGFTHSGGTFGTYLGSLRRNGLIETEDGQVRASDTLFKVGV
jgi:hypothetical protein